MTAVTTKLMTQDNLRVYDLAPASPHLIAVAGPDGHDAEKLDINHLPPGFRRIEQDEWEKLHNIT